MPRRSVLPFGILCPLAIGVPVFAVVAGMTEVVLMNSAAATFGGGDNVYRTVFRATAVSALVHAPLLLLPTLLATLFVFRRLGSWPWLLALVIAVAVGGVVAALTSYGIFAVFGGWGPPQLPAFVASGIGVALGWGLYFAVANRTGRVA
jgi:hypothetical protein